MSKNDSPAAADKAADKSTDKAQKPEPMIRVAALSDGYWRGGQQFSRTPRDLPVADVTREQLAAIRADARLVVVEL